MKTKKLDKTISRFARRFGIHRATCDNRFMYYIQNQTITYTIYHNIMDEDYINFLNTTYEINVRPWYFVFCILHEIGHHMTYDKLTAHDYALESFARTSIFPSMEDEKEINAAYWKLPAEDLANKWAIDYIDNHTKQCWRFQRKCYKIMKQIFKKAEE